MNDEANTAVRETAPSDEDITALFFSRSENAIMLTEKKYGKLLRHIASNILPDFRDVTECVNDTYLKLWNSIPPQKPASLRAYASKTVRNISLNRSDYNNAEKRCPADALLEELSDSIPDRGTEEEEGEIGKAIDAFLRGIDRESRAIFVLRYWYFEPEENIAKKLGASVPKIKSRLFRTRKKLKNHLEKEGISL